MSSTSTSSTSSSYVYFAIIGKDDNPLYQQYFGTPPAKDLFPLHQMFLFSSLDIVDRKKWSTSQPYLKMFDKLDRMMISGWVTPSNTIFLLLHFEQNEDNIKNFFSQVQELYIKVVLNPFYDFNTKIFDKTFDSKVLSAGAKLAK